MRATELAVVGDDAVRNLWSAIIGCAVVAGCSHPLLDYRLVTGPDRMGSNKYQLAASVITFSHGKTAAGTPSAAVVIASVPVAYGDKLYSLAPASMYHNRLVETNIGVTWRNDTRLIQEIDVSLTDHGVQAIQALGSAAGAAGGLLSLAPTFDDDEARLPAGLPVEALLEGKVAGCPVADRNGPVRCANLAFADTADYTADIVIDAVPVDALPAAELMKSFSDSVYFYSACRPATVTLSPRHGAAITASVVVADPLWLETIALPAKGKIVSGASCGTSVASEAANLPTSFDYINALMSQAKAVADKVKK